MKKFLCCVHDSVGAMYMAPMSYPSLGVAIREFGDECQRAESRLRLHPKDYTLHCIAVWDDQTGEISQEGDDCRMLARASEYVKEG